MKHTLLPSVCQRILATWCSVSPEIVEKRFKVTVMSNKIDGSKDFMVRDIESDSNDNGHDTSDSE
jgi:hypothetical protein